MGARTATAQTEIEFWRAVSGDNGVAVEALAELFNEGQTEYAVVPVYTGSYEEGTQRLAAAIAGNTAPGLVMLEITRYGLFADRGVLAPLQSYMGRPAPNGSSRSDRSRSRRRSIRAKATWPRSTSRRRVMYYTKDLFRAAGLDPNEPPRTWDEVTGAGKALTLRDGDEVTQWGIASPPQ